MVGGRPKIRLVVSLSERAALERWAKRPKTSQALACRATNHSVGSQGFDEPSRSAGAPTVETELSDFSTAASHRAPIKAGGAPVIVGVRRSVEEAVAIVDGDVAPARRRLDERVGVAE